MDEAYRDRTAALQARADALESENRELRERAESLERELRLARARPSAASVQHSGRIVVIGLLAAILTIFGSAAYMFMQLRGSPQPYVLTPADPGAAQPPAPHSTP